MHEGVSDDSLSIVVTAISALPNDMEALLAFAAAAVLRADEAEAKLANANARESATAGKHPVSTAGGRRSGFSAAAQTFKGFE